MHFSCVVCIFYFSVSYLCARTSGCTPTREIASGRGRARSANGSGPETAVEEETKGDGSGDGADEREPEPTAEFADFLVGSYHSSAVPNKSARR